MGPRDMAGRRAMRHGAGAAVPAGWRRTAVNEARNGAADGARAIRAALAESRRLFLAVGLPGPFETVKAPTR